MNRWSSYVSHRADLTYVIGEMIGELNVGHAYVGGGDMPKAARVPMGLLGGKLRKDPKTGYVQIVRMLKGARWDANLHSPLNELGVEAKDGDWIIAIDGQPTNEMTNIYEALVNKVGKPVSLQLNSQPVEKGSRKVTVAPIASEAEPVLSRLGGGTCKKVSDASGGRVGYLHVPDMQADRAERVCQALLSAGCARRR